VEPSDEELCKRVAARDAQAFELLVARHQAAAYRLARAMLGNDSDARDVSQEAFLRLYEAAHQFDARARFSTWFHRILVNLCIDHQRRGRWWSRLLPLARPGENSDEENVFDPPSPDPGPDAQAIRTQTRRRLRAALASLSPSQRAAIALMVEEDLSSKEIAQVLKCSDNTARVHIHRAVTQLKKVLKED
jgi:RNA polymerase sigma-70 factor (ECF subfamily)